MSPGHRTHYLTHASQIQASIFFLFFFFLRAHNISVLCYRFTNCSNRYFKLKYVLWHLELSLWTPPCCVTVVLYLCNICSLSQCVTKWWTHENLSLICSKDTEVFHINTVVDWGQRNYQTQEGDNRLCHNREQDCVCVRVCVYMRRSENMPWLGNGREHTPTHTDCLLMNGWTTSTVLTGWTRVLLITTWSLNTSIVRAKRGVRTRDVTSERVTVATHLFLQREIFIVFTFSVLVKIWDGFSHIISSQRLEVRTLSKVK